MSSTQHPQSFPALPASLSAGNHGVQDTYDAQDTQRATPHTLSNITPYLGLRSRMSQVWINRWTVLLLLILVRVLIAIAGLNNDLDSARTEAMSACTSVEDMGSAMVSMPHYLSAGVNELAASGIEKAVAGLFQMLLMTITGVEELIVFYIHMLTQTYLCLITLVVSGTMHVALQVIEDATKFLNSTVKDIGKGLAKGIDGFQDDMNGFLKGINSIPQAFGKKSGPPKIDVKDDLGKLQNLQLPDGINKDLDKLNNSIPTFKEVQNFTDGLIRLPFEELKKLIGGKLKFEFDRKLLPVPQKEELSFCSKDNPIEGFFDDLADLANIARKAFTAVLLIFAILVCVPMALQEYRRWNTMKKRSELVADKSFDPMDVVYIASRPYTATAGIKAAAPFKSSKRQVLARWVIAYATSPPALLVLSLGITGLLACLCQYVLLKVLVKEVPGLAKDVGKFADEVVHKLDNASQAWANGTNGAITHINNDINHDVFGWVNTSTGAINKTLNAFINGTIGELNKTFGGTVLYEPVKGVFDCIIGLKVEAFQKGLTWVSDHAHVDFPLLRNDTFSMGAVASIGSDKPKDKSFLASPGDAAADKITSAVVKVAKHLEEGIRNEAIISTCVVLLWVIIVLGGVGRAAYLAFQSEKGRGEGGPSYAGDIPLENRYTISDPSPAYEPTPTHPTAAARAFPSFAEPMGHDRSASRGGENEWQDRKMGFGAERTPEQGQAPRHESFYPTVEKHG